MTTTISVAGLTKHYGPTVALDDVDLDVPRGQFVAVIGLSGSGKSTLLRHLNGLIRPTTGSARVLDVDVATARPAALRALRRRVGFIFQQFNLVGRTTCLENVLNGALGRLRAPRLGVLTYSSTLRREAFVHLDRVGLADQAFQRADTLSGGQQQRVAIARSLMQRPELLLADEPVASLDPESSGQVLALMRDICVEEHLTVVCSLHQIELALDWTHHIVGLREGRKVLDRPTSSLDQDEVRRVYSRSPRMP